MYDISTQTSSKSTSPTQTKPRPLYRLERRESGRLAVIFDGLSLVECYDRMDKIPGLHIRLSYLAAPINEVSL